MPYNLILPDTVVNLLYAQFRFFLCLIVVSLKTASYNKYTFLQIHFSSKHVGPRFISIY